VLATSGAVLDRLIERCRTAPVHAPEGVVSDVVGLIVEVGGLNAAVGDTLQVRDQSGARLDVEVVGFRGGRLLTTPLGPLVGIRPGARIGVDGRNYDGTVSLYLSVDKRQIRLGTSAAERVWVAKS